MDRSPAKRSSKKLSGNSKGAKTQRAPVVGIIMGSDSDFPTMKDAAAALEQFGLSFEMSVVSAHRTPQEMADYARDARARGLRVIIAGAGGAAHLPGMVAAQCALPVIGVPVPIGPLQGQDALMSIVQMPKGVPVATVAIGNAFNAGLLAAQILASADPKGELIEKIEDYKEGLRKTVLSKKLPAREK